MQLERDEFDLVLLKLVAEVFETRREPYRIRNFERVSREDTIGSLP